MWGESKWQYFTSTIVSFDPKTMCYTIDWDDKDPTGRVVHYENIALNQKPDKDLIGIGSSVLFQQVLHF